jgi:hypothetical protein
MYEVNQALTSEEWTNAASIEQTRGDRLEAASLALNILIEAWRIGNITSDEYARHTARVYGEMMEFLAEPDEEK